MNFYRWEAMAPRLAGGECWAIDIPRHVPGLSRDDGLRIARWNPQLIAVYRESAAVFDFGFAIPQPIFSLRLRRFFETEYPGLIQFLPLRLQRDDGALPMHGYSIGKLLCVVDCVDKQRTIIREDPTSSQMETHQFQIQGPPCLRASAVGDHVCFRVFGAEYYIIVREDLRARLDEEGFVGCRFSDIRVSRA